MRTIDDDFYLAKGNDLVLSDDQQPDNPGIQTYGLFAQPTRGVPILLTIDGTITVGNSATKEANGIRLDYVDMRYLASLVLNGTLDVTVGMPGQGASGIVSSDTPGHTSVQSLVNNGTVRVRNLADGPEAYLNGAGNESCRGALTVGGEKMAATERTPALQYSVCSPAMDTISQPPQIARELNSI